MVFLEASYKGHIPYYYRVCQAKDIGEIVNKRDISLASCFTNRPIQQNNYWVLRNVLYFSKILESKMAKKKYISGWNFFSKARTVLRS